MSKSVFSPKIPTPKLATANKRKNNVIDDEGLILPSKSSKILNSLSNGAPNIETDNKLETLSNMSDSCADMGNVSSTIPSEPKPQPTFMKLVENFSEIITSVEDSLNSVLKKKVTDDFIQIYPADITR